MWTPFLKAEDPSCIYFSGHLSSCRRISDQRERVLPQILRNKRLQVSQVQIQALLVVEEIRPWIFSISGKKNVRFSEPSGYPDREKSKQLNHRPCWYKPPYSPLPSSPHILRTCAKELLILLEKGVHIEATNTLWQHNNSCLPWNIWFEKLWEQKMLFWVWKASQEQRPWEMFCGSCVQCWSVTVSIAEQFGKPQPRCSLSVVCPNPPILLQIKNEDWFLQACSN